MSQFVEKPQRRPKKSKWGERSHCQWSIPLQPAFHADTGTVVQLNVTPWQCDLDSSYQRELILSAESQEAIITFL